MDWFRWWHGTVTDPKFKWVARRSKQTVANVVSVWACLLECASTATHCNADATRGNVAAFDCNDIDVLLELNDGTVQQIYDAMVEKKLIVDGRLASWDGRQPKREDSGNPTTGALSSTERSRLRRERLKCEATHATAMQREETHGNDREDERRVEDKNETTTSQSPIGNGDSLAVPTAGNDPVAADAHCDPLSALTELTEATSMTIKLPPCPIDEIVALYHECMPKNPPVRTLNKSRRRIAEARWREAAVMKCGPFGYVTKEDGLAAWRDYFSICNESAFLTNQVPPRPGHEHWKAGFDFLISEKGFTNALEDKYHGEAA
ncbi:conserved hypothetical protein [Burkholderia sp. 8Y]|uniref:hypothetical protein n=1 Tax=Burkholderia sp. 8Y TaxID=2653133 RepID=UPI0012F2D3E6|nr:hypothetical protein [Burkholderia sp. 8Y]VXC59964.1 conserved hypothetical protein [Burkholderia sp. 8Y]